MSISQSDIEAVQAVLRGQTGITAFVHASKPTRHVLLAQAVLVAGSYEGPEWQGQFGDLLAYIVLHDVKPPKNAKQFWASHTCQRLIPASKRLGLHTATRSGGQLVLTPNDAVREVLADDACRQTAAAMFDQAITAVRQAKATERDYKKRIQRARQAIKNHPELASWYMGREIRNILLQAYPKDWAKVHRALDEVLRKHLPEFVDDTK